MINLEELDNLISNSLSGILSGLFLSILSGIIIIVFKTPYKKNRVVFEKILKLEREYQDPNDLESGSIKINYIVEQMKQIQEIQDLIESQKQTNKFLYWLFNYKYLYGNLYALFEYIRNPIMLPQDMVYKETFRLDAVYFFADLKKEANKPQKRILIFVLLIAILFLIA